MDSDNIPMGRCDDVLGGTMGQSLNTLSGPWTNAKHPWGMCNIDLWKAMGKKLDIWFVPDVNRTDP
jgi:hypothetical protein